MEMRVFAIGDLHLSGGTDKPMDVFGPQWNRHFERISESWKERIRKDDIVLIPGDISWAMNMEEARPDLDAIGMLPGRKILLKGNHDYWWSSVSRVRSMVSEDTLVLQYNALDLGPFIVCGSRGWSIPTKDDPLSPEDEKLYRRELMRLELSLKEAALMACGRPIISMMHFPPLYDQERNTGFTDLLEAGQVQYVVYGHLHGDGIRAGFNGNRNGIDYRLVSSDALKFQPLEILSFD